MTKIFTFILLFFSAVVLIFILSPAVGNTAPPILVDGQTGKYLGRLGGSQYDQDSTNNIYGRYGSPYSND